MLVIIIYYDIIYFNKLKKSKSILNIDNKPKLSDHNIGEYIYFGIFKNKLYWFDLKN